MPLIDDRGRLFGRVNVIDAAIVAFLLVLMPIVYTASRLFRVPKPEIERVEPATQLAGPGRRIRVLGRNLRPYLTAVASPTGHPSLIAPSQVNVLPGSILLVSPSLIEIDLPALEAGPYDLRLFDTTQEVARLTHAFSLTAPPAPPLPPQKKPDRQAVVHAVVRFVVLPEIARLIRENDVAATENSVEGAADPAAVPPPPPPPPAVLRSFRVVLENLPPTIDFGYGWGAKLIEADLVIPVRQNPKGEWDYRQQIIRIGAGFGFQTPAYTMNGIIGQMSVSPVKGAPRSAGEDK
jgi:hypothetical protein